MTTGLDAFDSTLQQTNLWLKDIMERTGTDDRHLAYQLLRATLHVCESASCIDPDVTSIKHLKDKANLEKRWGRHRRRS
jgi:hypothetical protein